MVLADESAEIERLVAACAGRGADAEAAGAALRVYGDRVVQFIAAEYRRSHTWEARSALLYYAIPHARTSEEAFRLGLEALHDRSYMVRYRACMILAYSLREDALRALEAIRSHGCEDAGRCSACHRRDHASQPPLFRRHDSFRADTLGLQSGRQMMARTIFDQTSRDSLIARLDRLTPDVNARWGEMTSQRMLCHLSDSVQVGMGEVPAQQKHGHLANPVARWLVAYVIPFPKGRKTAPEMLSSSPGEWQKDLGSAKDVLRRASQRGPDGKWAPHPAFGAVSGKLYGVLIYKHYDHHLRQFGV